MPVRRAPIRRPAAEERSEPAERHLTIWSGEQLKAFLASVERERLYALWRLYAVSGCRRGEALAVTWDDIDMDRGRWEIRRSLVTIGNAVVLGAPKSGRGRVVALDQVTVATLRTHRARQNEERLAWGPAYEDGNLMFCRESGTHLHPNAITHAFVLLVARAGLPKIRLHDVRHSAVTAMLRSGIPVKVVAERVGQAAPRRSSGRTDLRRCGTALAGHERHGPLSLEHHRRATAGPRCR